MSDDAHDDEPPEEPTKVNPQADPKMMQTLALPEGAGAPAAGPKLPPRAGSSPAVAGRAPIETPSTRSPGASGAYGAVSVPKVGPAIRPVTKPGLSSPLAGVPVAGVAAKPPPSSKPNFGKTLALSGPSAAKPAVAASAAAAPPKAPEAPPPAPESEPPDSGGTLILTPAQGGAPRPGPNDPAIGGSQPHQAGALDQTLAFGAPGGPSYSSGGYSSGAMPASTLGSPAADAPWGSPAADAAWPTSQGAIPQAPAAYPAPHVMGQGGDAGSLGYGMGTLPQGMSPPGASPGNPPGYGPPGAPYGAPHLPPPGMPGAQGGYAQGGYAQGGYGPSEYGQPQGYVPPSPATYGNGPAPLAKPFPVLLLAGAIGLFLLVVGGGFAFFFATRSPEPSTQAAPSATASTAPTNAPTAAVVATAEPPSPSAAPAEAPAPTPLAEAPAAARTAESPAPVAPTASAPTARAPAATAAPAATPRQVAGGATPVPTPTAKDAPAASDPSGWNEAQARSRLAQANGVLSFCKREGGITGPGKASVTFANDGNVAAVAVDPPYTGTREGDCVAGQFKRAKVSPFEGSPHVLRHPFEIPK